MDQQRASTQTALPDVESAARKQTWRLLLLGVLVIQLTWMLNVYPYWKETNSASRVYLTMAIVDYGKFQIDECLALYGDTLDKAVYGGHYYTDKAPGTSFLFVPVAWIVSTMTPDQPGKPHAVDMQTLFYTLRLLCISLPTIAFWWLMLPWFRLWTGREDRAVAVVAAGALGTNFCIYATQLFAHVPAGVFLFLAFLSVRRCWSQPDGQQRVAPGLVGGLLAGLAFLNDYVVLVAVAVLGLATLAPRFRWRPPLLFGLGVAPSLAIWMTYNWVCFGHPLKTGFLYHAAPIYGDAYQSGFLGIQRIDPWSAPGMLFSPARGMWFLSPVLALAPIGWWRQIRHGGAERRDAICAAAAFAGLFCFAMTTIDWRGGWGTGTRYLVPAVPFLLVGVAGAIRATAARDAGSIVFGALATVGVVFTSLASATVPLFPQNFGNPMFSLVWPLVRNGYLGPHLATSSLGAWLGLLPFGAAVVVTLWLVTSSGPAQSARVRWGSAGLSLLLAVLVIAWQASIPEPPADQLDRDLAYAEALSRLGYFDAATEAMLNLTPADYPAAPTHAQEQP